jgi:MFS family permease
VGDVLKGKGGQVIALMQMSGDFAAMVAPVLLGAISDLYGYRPAFLISAVITTVIFVVATRIPETRNTVHKQPGVTTDL